MIICADDYGLAPGVNQAIEELCHLKKISAVSIMCTENSFLENAKVLSTFNIDRGLHFTLTEPFFRHHFIGLTWIKESIVLEAFTNQWNLFYQTFGHAPHFIDGHQHIHLHPRISKILLTSPLLQNYQGYWRAGAVESKNHSTSLKHLLFAVFSNSLAAKVQRHGHKTCEGIWGFYNLRAGVKKRDYFPQLDRPMKKLLFFTHPGFVDTILVKRDPITENRHLEFELLKNADVTIDRFSERDN